MVFRVFFFFRLSSSFHIFWLFTKKLQGNSLLSCDSQQKLSGLSLAYKKNQDQVAVKLNLRGIAIYIMENRYFNFLSWSWKHHVFLTEKLEEEVWYNDSCKDLYLCMFLYVIHMYIICICIIYLGILYLCMFCNTYLKKNKEMKKQWETVKKAVFFWWIRPERSLFVCFFFPDAVFFRYKITGECLWGKKSQCKWQTVLIGSDWKNLNTW